QNEYMVLFFGFVNWFKGADCFVNTFKNKEKFLGKKVRFIIAGGESPTLKNRAYYQEYYSQVVESIKESKSIEITGYVPQEKIATYFSACDLVVLPYRNFMTASGVLSLVFSYKKPFILSEELGKMFQAADFQEALKSAGLRTSDLVFKLDKESCLKLTEKVLTDGLKPKMVRMAEIIRNQRSYKNIAVLYEKVLFEPSVAVSDQLALSYRR
ncbi:MAG: glycosyl transferase, partial [uncultured bacterium]